MMGELKEDVTVWSGHKNGAVFVSCPDWVAAEGVRELANPIGSDPKVISGESGAVTLGLLVEIMTNPDYKKLKEELQLDKTSQVLLYSTEGDTDPSMYHKIVNEDIVIMAIIS